MFINKSGTLYEGDLVTGDREAKAEEVTAWELSRVPTYKQLRAAAYPSLGDQLGAMWKGGEEQAAMLQTILAVKAEFPKV